MHQSYFPNHLSGLGSSPALYMEAHWKELVGCIQRRRLIHVFVRPTNTVMLPLTEISAAYSRSHFCHTLQTTILSSVKHQNDKQLHLLVTR